MEIAFFIRHKLTVHICDQGREEVKDIRYITSSKKEKKNSKLRTDNFWDFNAISETHLIKFSPLYFCHPIDSNPGRSIILISRLESEFTFFP